MAIMIPDSCPSRATEGEKRVYALLRDALPDNFTCWYEPVIQGRYPDFTLLADDFGLLVLEVKGWYLANINRVNDHEVEHHKVEDGQTRVLMLENPIAQARNYLYRAREELSRPEYSILQQDTGKYRGKLRFPGGFGVVFTNITRAHLDEAGLSTLFPPDRVICRDELTTLAGSGDREVIRRLRQLFPEPFPFIPLTADQIKTIQGAIHREVVVKARPATAASVAPGQLLLPGAVALDVLDATQEQVARSLGEGHHVLFGIAGSGKTTLILARARMLAQRNPSHKILILCYNKALAFYLNLQLKGDPNAGNIETRTFHSWAVGKTGLRQQNETFEDFESRVIESFLSMADHGTESDKYDVILIDEAHDFEPDWFRCIMSLLKGGTEGGLLIAADGAQSLYDRNRQFTWKSVGVNAVGRARRLSRCYRNTKEILEFAWQVAQSTLIDAGASETHQRVLPTKAGRHGPPPLYRGCVTIAEEHAQVGEIVDRFRSLGVPHEEIAVLYPRNEDRRADDLCRALRRGHEVCWISNEKDKNGGVGSLVRPGVRLSTIHSAKGLEFRAVIVTGLDLLPNWRERDEIRDGNLLYVGLTRAIDHLAVTWVGCSSFTDKISRSTKAVTFETLSQST